MCTWAGDAAFNSRRDRASARAGVLIKTAESLEALELVDTVVVDKTGTLTEGRLGVVAVVSRQEVAESEDELLRLAAGIEKGSEHPLAEAIVRAAQEKGLWLGEVRDFEAIAGRGVPGCWTGRLSLEGRRNG